MIERYLINPDPEIAGSILWSVLFGVSFEKVRMKYSCFQENSTYLDNRIIQYSIIIKFFSVYFNRTYIFFSFYFRDGGCLENNSKGENCFVWEGKDEVFILSGGY